MKLNDKIKKAIETAVKDEGQPAELANKLIAWMESLTEGNEQVADVAEYTKRCKLCFDTTSVKN